MIKELLALLRRVLGHSTPPPPPKPLARPSAAQRAVENPMRIEYQNRGTSASLTPASVAWYRDRPRAPRFSLEAWRRRMSLRQRVLLAAAAVSLVAEIVFLGARLLVNRRLPAETFGVWATAAPGYADRFFELRARRVAFVTGDSTNPVTVHLIRRVRRAEVEDGERFTVEYEVNGGVLAFQFVYTGAPRPRIRFVNQPRMAWERTGATRTLMPEIY